MGISVVTVCNKNMIRTLNGLPDVPYPIAAILAKNTTQIKAIYHDGNQEEPAHIDVSAACRKLSCFPSDIIVLEWGDDLAENFGGTPWVRDIYNVIGVPCNYDEPVYIVDDFSDLY
jgi:hypothetical protein